MSENTPEKGIYRMTGEYLLYYGLLTRDASWLEKSATIYRSRSLEAALTDCK